MPLLCPLPERCFPDTKTAAQPRIVNSNQWFGISPPLADTSQLPTPRSGAISGHSQSLHLQPPRPSAIRPSAEGWGEAKISSLGAAQRSSFNAEIFSKSHTNRRGGKCEFVEFGRSVRKKYCVGNSDAPISMRLAPTAAI
jgi:hypothetical protein